LVPTPGVSWSRILINEILASNGNGLRDQDGAASDWIELYHAGVSAATLTGYGLTDDPGEPLKWKLPAIVLQPGEFLLVWASGKDRAGPEYHTNFALDREGEFAGLASPAGIRLDSFDFPEQARDVSYGRFPDGGESFVNFSEPTPGTSNRSVPTAQAPSFSQPAGFYSTGFFLTAEAPDPDAAIRYTTDGSIPAADSLLYELPLEVTRTTVIRARAFSVGQAPSPVVTATYFLEDAGTLPTLSLVTAPENLWDASTGIYANPQQRGDEWERPVHIEFIENGSLSFRESCGARTHGNFSRTFAKKSLRLYFRSEYGADRLQAPIFADPAVASYKRLVLSAGGNDSSLDPRADWNEGWSLIRDAVMSRLFQETGTLATDARPVRLYLNGEPWGIYFMKERIDRFFVEDHFSYSDFDLLQRDTELFVEEGTDEEWNRLETLFQTSDLSDPVAFASAETWIDIDNFIDHYIIEMWAANYDWPQNNLFHLRPRGPTGQFQWIPWDTDASLAAPTTSDATRDIYPHVTGMHVNGLDWSTLWFRKLLDNESFRIRFVNRIADLLNTALKGTHAKDVVEGIAGSVRPNIGFETDRWGASTQEWEENVQQIVEFARDRESHFFEHTRNYFNLPGTMTLTIEEPQGMGAVRINRNRIDAFPWSGKYFQNVPIPLAALPAPGYRFVRWEGTAALPDSASVTLTANSDLIIRALFEPIPYPPRSADLNLDGRIDAKDLFDFSIRLYRPLEQ
jgi:hypothetical protein